MPTISTIINASADTFIDSVNALTNYGNSIVVAVGRGIVGNMRRGLMSFDLSVLPYGTQILTCSLSMHVFSNTSSTAGYIAKLRSFTEGDGTSGSGADWNTYDGVNTWYAAGAQNGIFDHAFFVNRSDYSAITATSGRVTVVSSAALAAVAQDAIQNENGQCRLFQRQSVETINNNVIQFYSRNAGSNLAPQLHIQYVCPQKNLRYY